MGEITLVEREGKLYAKDVSTDFFEPKNITLYWPTGIRFHDFSMRFASQSLARDYLGIRLHWEGEALRDDRGLIYHLPDGRRTKSEIVETETIPEPKQRGRKLPVRWRDGQWWKETQKGWVRA